MATADCVVTNVTAWNCEVVGDALETKYDCVLPGSQAVKEVADFLKDTLDVSHFHSHLHTYTQKSPYLQRVCTGKGP